MREVRLTKLTVSQCQLVFTKILNLFVYNVTLSHMLTNLCQSQDTTNYMRSRIVSGSGTNMDLSLWKHCSIRPWYTMNFGPKQAPLLIKSAVH